MAALIIEYVVLNLLQPYQFDCAQGRAGLFSCSLLKPSGLQKDGPAEAAAVPPLGIMQRYLATAPALTSKFSALRPFDLSRADAFLYYSEGAQEYLCRLPADNVWRLILRRGLLRL